MGQENDKDIISHQILIFYLFKVPLRNLCFSKVLSWKGPINYKKKKETKAYLTTAWTYGELLFSCAFADGPIEVTVKKSQIRYPYTEQIG